jgi:hypothetical protein
VMLLLRHGVTHGMYISVECICLTFSRRPIKFPERSYQRPLPCSRYFVDNIAEFDAFVEQFGQISQYRQTENRKQNKRVHDVVVESTTRIELKFVFFSNEKELF